MGPGGSIPPASSNLLRLGATRCGFLRFLRGSLMVARLPATPCGLILRLILRRLFKQLIGYTVRVVLAGHDDGIADPLGHRIAVIRSPSHVLCMEPASRVLDFIVKLLY